MSCPAELKSGDRMGQQCGAKVKDGHRYCLRHTPKDKEKKSQSESTERKRPTVHMTAHKASDAHVEELQAANAQLRRQLKDEKARLKKIMQHMIKLIDMDAEVDELDGMMAALVMSRSNP